MPVAGLTQASIAGCSTQDNTLMQTLNALLTAVQAATAVTALTDNSAGTADNTVQAMPNPADAPASADALREDFVANIMPAIRNNIADLAAKVNEIRAALATAGILS